MESYRGGVSPSAVSREASAHGRSRATNGAASAFCAGVKPTLLGFAAFALAAAAATTANAGTRYWVPSDGGDMADASNWGANNTTTDNTLPTSSDLIVVNKAQAAPITLSEDLAATGGDSQLNASATYALTNAVGEAKTLTLQRIFVNSSSKTIRLAAGTLAFTQAFYMGDGGYYNDAFSVDGAGATLKGTGATIWVGSKCYSDSLIVTNGATATASSVYVGRTAVDSSRYATNNLLRVAGSGSSLAMSGSLYLHGAGSNRVEVLDGGFVCATNLYFYAGSYGVQTFGGNEVLVRGEGSKLAITGNDGGFFQRANAVAPRLVVEDGGAVEITGEFKFENGTNALVRVASGGSLVHNKTALQLGTGLTSVSNRLEVAGGSVRVATSNSGINVRGLGSCLAVSDGGTVTTAGNIAVDVSNDGGSWMSLSGAASKATVGATFSLNNSARLAVEIPRGGFADGAAPITCKTFTVGAKAKIEVALGRGHGNGERVVLVEAQNAISYPSGFAANVTLPEGATLDTTTNTKQLAVKLPNAAATVIEIR